MFDKKTFAEALDRVQGERTMNAYARDSGVSAAYISRLKRGMVHKAPSPEILYKLADKYIEGASYGDLMAMAGHIVPFEESEKMRAKKFYLMKNNPIYTALNPDLEERYASLNAEERKELDQFMEVSTTEDLINFIMELSNIEDITLLNQGARDAESLTNELPSNIIEVSQRTVRVPVLGEIACGDPILVEANYEDYRTVLAENLPTGNLVYLQAKGDSMHPTIPDGSMVLIRIQEEVENGEIAAVTFNLNAHATLKRVKKQDGLIILMPDNPAHEPIVVTRDNPVRIIGKAVKLEQEL